MADGIQQTLPQGESPPTLPDGGAGEPSFLPLSAGGGSDATVVKAKSSSDSAEATQDASPAPVEYPSGNGAVLATSKAGDQGLVRGQLLAHFLLEETLGVGGMATVVRAKDTTLDRLVALKILPPSMAADSENVQRFHNEARAAAKLDHESIARVYSFGSDQGLHFIAYEFVEGETLRARIEREGRLPVNDVLQLALEIGRGLVHAADRGVVHRDIKPSNILLSSAGPAKLVDMGLARSLQLNVKDGLTHSGVTLGTFDYISPEQALDPRTVDCRSDLYSLGCTLYHALTGQSPVPQGTALRKLQAHQHDAPVDPLELNPALPPEIGELLARLMAKQPTDRMQHPRELVAWLENWLGQATKYLPPTPPTLPAAGREQVDRRALLLLLGLLLMLGTAALTHWLYPPGEGRPMVAERLRPAAGSSPASSPANPLPRTAFNADELTAALFHQPTGLIVLTGPVYDLDSGLNLLPAGGELVLQAAPDLRPRLRLAELRPNGNRSLLRMQGGLLRLRGLRLEIADGMGNLGGTLVGLDCSSGRCLAEDCEFVQEADARLGDAAPARTDAAASLVSVSCQPQAERGEAEVECRRCVFSGGAVGIRVGAGGRVALRDALLAPFAQSILVADPPGGASRRPAQVLLQQVNLAVHQSALVLQTKERVQLEMRDSVFAPLPTSGGSATLLLFGQTDPALTELRSSNNAFCQLDTFAAVATANGKQPLARSLAELGGFLGGFTDAQSVMEVRSPWTDAAAFPRLAQRSIPQPEDFRLRTALASLRAGPQNMKGARTLLGEPLYDRLEPLAAEASSMPVAGVRDLVVDGQGRMPGVFATLNAALVNLPADAEATVLLRQSGTVLLMPVDLGNRRITLRAAPGFAPELQLHPDATALADGDAALFRLDSGTLNLEQLGVRLGGSPREPFRLQCLASIRGAGRMRLTSCQVTLQGESEPRSAVVALGESGPGAGGLPVASRQPTVGLTDTLIRGRGDVALLRRPRPFVLEVRNSVAVLQGSFLAMDFSTAGEAVASSESQRQAEPTALQLDRLSLFATQGLVWNRIGPPGMGAALLRIDASQCLFAAGEGQPLLRLEGPRSEAELRRSLTWKGQRNLYGLSPLLVWQPPERFEMPRTLERDRWQELWGRDDDQPRFTRGLKLAGDFSGRANFESLQPSALRPLPVDANDMEIESFGADLSRVFSLENPSLAGER